MDWIHLAQGGEKCPAVTNMYISIKEYNFLDNMRFQQDLLPYVISGTWSKQRQWSIHLTSTHNA